MMFIVRSAGSAPVRPGLRVAVARRTPDIIPNAAGKSDHFCIGEADDIAALREVGCEIVELRDGWYADDAGGGVGISGHGCYWEIRDTPLTVKEAVGASSSPNTAAVEGVEQVNVRQAIFGV